MCGNDVCNIEDDGDYFKFILYSLAVCACVGMPAHVPEGWGMPWCVCGGQRATSGS